MPSSPSTRGSVPPPRGSALKRAAEPVEVEDRVESTEPDDDLAQYIVPPDPAEDIDIVPGGEAAIAEAEPITFETHGFKHPELTTATTADTELVIQLQRELAAAQARLSGKAVDPANWAAAPPPAAPKDGEKVLIHVRQDGFTACGRVWYRGQELEFTVGAPNWQSTCDVHGKSWLLLSDVDQIRRYGEVMFGHGPWPGLSYDDARSVAAEDRRGRTAPSIQQLSALADKRRA
jgi:hypothetical protein